MKKFWLKVILTLMFLGNVPAFAYIIDGNLGDWGVTPFSDWVPNGSNADYAEGDWPNGSGRRPAGGEFYDQEALYFDNDADYLYFAKVASYPETGPYADNLKLSLNNKAYSIKIKGISLGLSNPALSLWGSATILGYTNVFYQNAGYLEGLGKGRTYILEGRASRLLFDPLPVNGTEVMLSYLELCRNDSITLYGDIDDPDPIPEPASLLLLGSGLLGLAYRVVCSAPIKGRSFPLLPYFFVL